MSVVRLFPWAKGSNANAIHNPSPLKLALLGRGWQ
jgi:hypothetical protein